MHIPFELAHGLFSQIHVSIALDGVENFLVEIAVVHHGIMSAALAHATRESIQQRFAFTAFGFAVIICMRVEP